LRTPADFRRYLGAAVAVRYRDEAGKRKSVKGGIVSVDDKILTVAETQLPWTDVIEGKLVI
jgi:ribosome maturation factor RimP